MVGQTISHYRIVSQLGAGGMGVVYAAEDQRLGRHVALKFVPEDLAQDLQNVERLKSEARTASGLNHANICTIYDIGSHEGRPFIVMELLQGQTLRDRMAAGPLKILEIVNVGIQVADALDSAHRRNIIHRDIKPANLFLIDRGQVKILDFGLAKLVSRSNVGEPSDTITTADLTGKGVTLGTVAYMSPEQVTGEPLDGRTDLFSFGVVLYECVTGHQPFQGKTSALIFEAILNRAPIAPVVFNPEMPLRLQEVITSCLEKDRELRYQEAAGLRADLLRLKRDLESGRSGVVRIPGGATSGSDSIPTQIRLGTPAQGRVEVEAPSTGTGATQRGGRTMHLRTGVAVVALAAVLLVGLASFMFWRRTAGSQVMTPSQRSLDVVDRNPLELAAASFRARNYRAALAFSEEVLKAEPDQAEAIRIRSEAGAVMARFDEAIARAGSLLAARDTDGVAAALEVARAIDPASPAVGELSAALVNEFKSQAEAARNARQSQPMSDRRAPATQRPAPGEVAPSNGQRQSVPEPPRSESAPPPAASPPASTVVSAPAPAPPPPTPSTTAAPSAAPSPPEPAPRTAPAPAAASPSEAPVIRRDSNGASAPPVEDDESAIRRVVATYARAIETKDLALFRSVKPNLSPEEQRRIEGGFRAVSSQRVSITILAVERRGQDAEVRLRRRDTIEAGGRQQTAESQQTMTLTRAGASWVIREIGR